jgi:hypothetical protein
MLRRRSLSSCDKRTAHTKLSLLRGILHPVLWEVVIAVMATMCWAMRCVAARLFQPLTLGHHIFRIITEKLEFLLHDQNYSTRTTMDTVPTVCKIYHRQSAQLAKLKSSPTSEHRQIWGSHIAILPPNKRSNTIHSFSRI